MDPFCCIHLVESEGPVKPFTTETLSRCHTIMTARRYHKITHSQFELPANCVPTVGYHAQCYSKFTALKTKYVQSVPPDFQISFGQMKKPKHDEPSTSSTATSSCRPKREKLESRMGVLKHVCVLCKKKRKMIRQVEQPLIMSAAKNFEIRLRDAAEKLADYELLSRLSTSDFVAQEVRYHRLCVLKFLAKARRVDKTATTWHAVRESHNHAFNYICQFIHDRIMDRGEVYTLAELHKEYMDSVKSFRGVTTLYSKESKRFPATKLRDKILSLFASSKLRMNVTGTTCLFFKETPDLIPEVVSEKFKEMQKIGQFKAVARELRAEILGLQKKPLPESVDVGSITKGECEIPEALTEFLNTLITGKPNLRDEKHRVKRHVASIAQDIIFSATDGRVKPEKHLSLGVALKTLTGSKRVINVLNRFGHTASYTTVEGVETELSYNTYNQSSILPASLKKLPNLATGVAFDNFDRFVETRSGKDTLHDTVGIVFQNVLEECDPVEDAVMEPLPGTSGPTCDDTAMISRSNQDDTVGSKRRRRAFEEVFKDIETYMKNPKPTFDIKSESSHSPLPKQELRKQAQFTDYLNVDIVWALMFTYKVPMTPMWVGYNASIFTDDLPMQKIAYLPQINASPTSYSVVLHTMKIALNLADECMQDSIICSYDLNIAKMALQLQQEEKPNFDRLFIFPGTFHIEDAYFKALGKIIDKSGITEILSECGVIAPGSISGFIGGTNYNRCRSVHPLIALVLRMLHYEIYVEHLASSEEESVSFKFQDYNTMQELLNITRQQTVAAGTPIHIPPELEKRILEYRAFEGRTLAGEHGKTAQFWMTYVKYIDTYHDFVRSVRMGNLDLFKKSLAIITDLFFALNHPNYARWNVVYMDTFDKAVLKDDSVAQQLNSGIVGIKRTSKPFSRSPIDLTLEQTINRDAGNKLGGIGSMTNSISARQRWAISHSQRTEVVTYVMEKAGLSIKEDITKDLKTYRISSDNARIQSLMVAMEGYVNPFAGDEPKDILFNICTGKSVTNETADFLLNIPNIGRTQHDEFRKACSINPGRFNEAIKRNFVQNFASETVKLKIQRADKIKEVKVERNLFARLLTLSIQNHIDLQTVMSFPLTPIPAALGHADGTLMKTNKSALFHLLEKKVEHVVPSKIDATIIDAFYFLHLIGNNLPSSFGGVAKSILTRILKMKCKTVYMVFDTYISPSIKDIERDLRAKGEENITKWNITSESQKRPTDFVKAMRNDSFKESLVSFLIQEWKKPVYKEYLQGLSFYANEKDDFYFYSASDAEQTYHCKVPSLTNSHAEADTKMIYILTNITKGNVVIKSSDTDVLVIAIGNIHHVRRVVNVYIETGTVSKNNLRYIDVRKIADQLGANLSQALPGFHALTGCDFTSSFYKLGKNKPLKILESNPNFHSTLGRLGLDEALTEEEFKEVEKFVCALYSKKKITNINDLRFSMFFDAYSKKSKQDPLKVPKGIDSCSLPPCRQVLREHVLRCKLVTILWSNLNSSHPPRISPTDYGWLEEDKSYKIRWFKGPALPNSLEDILLGTSDKEDEDKNDNDSDISLTDDDDDYESD